MPFNLQPLLENDNLLLKPLTNSDFESLYTVASNPKIWEQHPNKDRWKREIFETFFEGALQSNGAFIIIDKHTTKSIGSTRFYDYDPQESSILIGYTFYATEYWGNGTNLSVKKLLLDYAFQYVNTVKFQIGAENIRSQIAIGRIGAKEVGQETVSYFGEQPKLNKIYHLTQKEFLALSQK